MNPLLESLTRAIELLLSLNPEVYGTMLLTIRVTGTAVVVASLIGIPFGAFLGLRDFFGKRFITTIVNTSMGLPPVVVGLVVYLLLSSSGLLGPLELLFTPTAMIIAQSIMCIPIITGVTYSAVGSVDKSFVDTAISLGATGSQLVFTVLREARIGLLTAIITAFGAGISEVGAIMLVGGNIRFFTRTLTTSILLQTRMGEFSIAIALGIILLTMAFAVNLLLTNLQQKRTVR